MFFAVHRKQSYPLKATRSMKRRQVSPSTTPVDAPNSPTLTAKMISTSPSSIGSPIFHITGSDTVHYAPFNFDDDDACPSSESECILSDPSGYRSPPEISPDRKIVQFQDDEHQNEKKHKRGLVDCAP